MRAVIMRTATVALVTAYSYAIFLAYLDPGNVAAWSSLWSICR